MSTLGKICLSITLLLLVIAMAPIPGPWGGWAPKLLVAHNRWSEEIRDSKTSAEKASNAQFDALQELRRAKSEHDALVIGWDLTWMVPARGPDTAADAPRIEKRNIQLILRNIGMGSDPPLKPQKVDTQDPSSPTLSPVIHAFYSQGESSFTYAGEFLATDITQDSALLQPVHPVSPQEAASWPDNAVWRLRSIIPSAKRTIVDQLYNNGRRIAEFTRRTHANITQQERVFEEAERNLEIRQNELLGDPNREPVDTRPEFVSGLLKVNEDVEEQRNQLLLDIDGLRRAIAKSKTLRDEKIARLHEAMSKLPQSRGTDNTDRLSALKPVE